MVTSPIEDTVEALLMIISPLLLDRGELQNEWKLKRKIFNAKFFLILSLDVSVVKQALSHQP